MWPDWAIFESSLERILTNVETFWAILKNATFLSKNYLGDFGKKWGIPLIATSCHTGQRTQHMVLIILRLETSPDVARLSPHIWLLNGQRTGERLRKQVYLFLQIPILPSRVFLVLFLNFRIHLLQWIDF